MQPQLVEVSRPDITRDTYEFEAAKVVMGEGMGVYGNTSLQIFASKKFVSLRADYQSTGWGFLEQCRLTIDGKDYELATVSSPNHIVHSGNYIEEIIAFPLNDAQVAALERAQSVTVLVRGKQDSVTLDFTAEAIQKLAVFLKERHPLTKL
jgi:hypothetical protein